MNEQSPLLSPAQDDENGLKRVPSHLSDDDWNPEAGEDTKSSWYLLLLTLGGLGLVAQLVPRHISRMLNSCPAFRLLGLSSSPMAR